MSTTALVITSIAGQDHPVLAEYARECSRRGIPFYVMGDRISPQEFRLDGCDFYSLQRQRETGFSLVERLPERHYGRKNVGYLVAIREGAEIILETDDDNFAREGFWNTRARTTEASIVENAGWVNVYSFFTEANIWPRGFALEHLQDIARPREQWPVGRIDAPIQQGLADENPDVDAIYRLTLPLPLSFDASEGIGLGPGSWCPFNSQNTTWFKDAFPLMYLPSHCSFRMTDIWRSFVAQRIAWENGWHILFHAATVYQERNMHNLLRDFADEVTGYLNNGRIADALAGLRLKNGIAALGENLSTCYEKLVEMELVGREELYLVEAWTKDLRQMGL
ncbi:MAG: hypothetical protein RL213_1981 [Bacteroidota bacterium]|jgi:hypothetical protein